MAASRSPVTALAALAAAAFAPPCGAAGPPAIEAVAPWDGLVVAGQPTEVVIRVHAAAAATIVVRVEGTLVPSTLTFAPQATRTTVLALLPKADEDAVVTAVGPGGAVLGRTELALRPAGARPLIAVAGDTDTFGGVRFDENRLRPLFVAAHDLPRTIAGYGPIGALVIGREALTALSPPQVRALGGYLAMCGATVAVALPPAAVVRLRQAAGCGGERVAFVDTTATANAAVEALLAASPPSLPPPRAVAAALADRAGTARGATPLLLGFSAAYLIIATITAIVVRRTAVLIALPLVATTIGAAAAASGRPQIALLALAEMNSGASVGRYGGVIRIDGWGAGEARVALPGGTMVLAALPGLRQEVDVAADGAVKRTIAVPVWLASRNDVPVAGWFGQAAPAPADGEVSRGEAPQALRQAFAPLPVIARLVVRPARESALP